jgi:SAM-dependent methyltransferase
VRPSPGDDPVSISVAAYSSDPIGYEERYADHLLDRPERFSSVLRPSSRILDLGCGPGRDLRLFTAAGHRPVGLELNPSFVDMAQRHGEVIEGDIRDVAQLFAPSSFDGVWAQASLVHLSSTEVARALYDLRSLLVRGGHLYACVAATGVTGWREETDGRRWYTVWPGRAFAEAVATAGLEIIDVTDGSYIEILARRTDDVTLASEQ